MRQSSIWHWSPIFAKRVNGLFKLAAGFAGMAAVGAVLLVGIAANAQTSNGTIEGSVVDATGAGVAKATVSIVGVHTGATKTTATNGVGGFRFDSVLLDTYTVSAEAPGFSKRVITDVVVTASVITSVNPVLVSGSVTETVKVQAASELLQTDSGEISATMGTEAVENLPISSLSPYELATTLPGVAEPPPEFQDAAGMPDGVQFSVDGGRPRANNFLIEGQDNNDLGLHGQGLEPENLEAYQDVTFLLNSYSAEFGHGGGSVSNMILKSGTNNFHGAIWDRLENSSLDALDKGDLLNGATTKSKYRENLAGFSIGGPALKNKLFFFASYQFDHYRATANLNPVIVPTAAGYATLQSLSTGNPRIMNYLTALGSLLGQTGTPYTYNLQLSETNPATSMPYVVQVGPYRRNLKNQFDASEWDIKGDYIVSPSDTLQLHYIREPYITPVDIVTAMLPGFDTDVNSVAHNAGIAETHTFSPSLLNEFRFSYSRIGFTFGLPPATIANPLATTPTIAIGISQGAIPGTFGEVTGFGAPDGYPQGRFHNTYQTQDTVSWSKGRHTVRAGFDLPVVQVKDDVPFDTYGAIAYASTGKYSALANYIDDFGGSEGYVTQGFGSSVARPVFYYQNYFAEDNWKLCSNLTLELGLRYEYAGTPFNNLTYPGVTPASVGNYLSKVPEQADTDDWGPRFGFAYTPGFLGEKKTVIRGGFGIFYDGLFTFIDDDMLALAPNAASPQIFSSVSGSAPRGKANLSQQLATLSRTPGPTDRAEYITPEMASPRILQWNLNVERELPFSFTGQVGYVGTRGEHLFATTEFNPYVNNEFGDTTRIFNTRGNVMREDNTGDSIYHALQAQLVRKYRNGFSFRGAYTFSRMEDDVSEILTEEQFSTYPVQQYPNARKTTDYGLSAFDHRQRLVFSYVYAIPQWSEAPKGVGEVVNGWQISGVSQFQSGNPANVEIGSDWNGDSIGNDRPDVGNPKAPLASFAMRGDDPVLGFGSAPGTLCDGPSWANTGNPCVPVSVSSVRWVLPYYGTNGPVTPVGRNNVILRGFQRWDFSAQKSFHTYKEESFDFRAEMFDIFNHGNTGTPNLNIETGFAGVMNGDPANIFGDYAPTVTGHRSIRLYMRYRF
jgi:hypothetical protein